MRNEGEGLGLFDMFSCVLVVFGEEMQLRSTSNSCNSCRESCPFHAVF